VFSLLLTPQQRKKRRRGTKTGCRPKLPKVKFEARAGVKERSFKQNKIELEKKGGALLGSLWGGRRPTTLLLT
jgi:hypothetical protein